MRRATLPTCGRLLPPAISIHALREEGDPRPHLSYDEAEISIHALREEGDANMSGGEGKGKDFYPRPP